ncbi:MAG: DNA adenine methylase [Elusimicrobiota bacterium]
MELKPPPKSPLKAKPFLKWAGGKTQLLANLSKRLPQDIKESQTIKRYCEPFVGGGAFFFFLKNNYEVKKPILIDVNEELILAYKVIQSQHKELIKSLKKIEENYLAKNDDERKKFYYEIRSKYNKQKHNFNYKNESKNWVERTKFLIFLNKTCFNGLFRLNSKGEFNVPFGRYKNPTICNEKNLKEVHRALMDVIVLSGDFEEADKYIKKDAFVYFDPPYKPIGSSSYFTSYSKEGFTDSDQKRLAKFYKKLDKRGALLLLSNSDPKNEDPDNDFFDELYKDFTIERVDANRFINCDPKGRGSIKEIIIKNY